MVQTKIVHYLRKNKIDLTSTMSSLDNMTKEEEKREYEKLLQKLKEITDEEVCETTDFYDEISGIESQKNKIESKINHTEIALKDTKSKIVRSARNSQTNEQIHPEVISSIEKQETYKETELRKLRLANLREQNRLNQVRTNLMGECLRDREITDMCGQLKMENDVFHEELDKSNESNTEMKRDIAGNIVMMSHIKVYE